MLIGILFWTLTAIGCGYAAYCGGRDGKWAAFLIIGAALLTIPATLQGQAWITTEYAVLIVDSLLLGGLFILTLRSDRLFPIWMTGLHLLAVITHLSTLVAPDFAPKIYRALGALWAVPMTLSMIIGIHLDRASGVFAAKPKAP